MRVCSVSSCSYPVFGTDKLTRRGFYSRHQFLRTDKKKKEFTPGKPIAKRTTRKPMHKIDWGFTTQIDLFMNLWEKARDEKGNVICQYTGEKLNRFEDDMTMFLTCFAHVLNKKNWPIFKLNPENIRIVFPEFHRCVDQGTMADKFKHPTWKFDLWDTEVIEMKLKYFQFKHDNMLA